MKTATFQNEAAPDRDAAPDVLVSARWLEAHLHDPGVRVVEVDVSRLNYDEWHIDGAVLWNIYADLKDPGYRLVEADAIARLLSRSGITPHSTVVFYGYAPALGFWLMTLYGHADVRILNCSRSTWRAEGRSWSRASRAPERTVYELSDEDGRVRATHPTVLEAIDTARARASRQQFDPVGHYNRPDVFRLLVDTSPRPAVIETNGAAADLTAQAP